MISDIHWWKTLLVMRIFRKECMTRRVRTSVLMMARMMKGLSDQDHVACSKVCAGLDTAGACLHPSDVRP